MQAHRPSHAECLAFEGAGQGASSQAGGWAGAGGGALGCDSEEEGSPQSRVRTITVAFCAFLLCWGGISTIAMGTSQLEGALDLEYGGLVCQHRIIHR